MLAIRDQRLYRETHGTFEDYCRERWGMSRFYAHRLIEASEVAALLPMGNITNELQARALAPLKDEPELARQVYGEVASSGPVTATALSAAAVAITESSHRRFYLVRGSEQGSEQHRQAATSIHVASPYRVSTRKLTPEWAP